MKRNNSSANKNSNSIDNQNQKTLLQFWTSKSDLNDKASVGNSGHLGKTETKSIKKDKISNNNNDLAKQNVKHSIIFNTNEQNDMIKIIEDDDEDEIKFLKELSDLNEMVKVNNRDCKENDNSNNNANNDDDLELIEATDRFLNETYSRNHHNTTNSTSIINNKSLGEQEELTIGLDDNKLQCTQFVNSNGFDIDAGSIW